jgi:hypothetical protein
MPQEIDRCRATTGRHALDPHTFRRAASAALSGAGPGVVAFAETGHSAIQQAMEEAAKRNRMDARGLILRVSNLRAEKEDQPVDGSSFFFGKLISVTNYFTVWGLE